MSNAVGELAILRLIQSRSATSQIELARALGLPANTVHGMVKRLEAKGLIVESHQQRGGRGRPSVHFGIRIAGRVLVIKWLGTEWRGVVMGDGAEPLGELARFTSPPISCARDAAAHFLRLRDSALRNSGLRLDELDGAIVMINAFKQAGTGLLASTVIPWIGEVTESHLSEVLGCEVMISSMPHAAELELRSWTREGVRSLAVFNVGDGVSAHYASLVGPWAQVENLPGEVGQIERKPGGESCGGGNFGRLESLIGGAWMLRRVSKDVSSGAQTRLADSLKKSPEEFFGDLETAAKDSSDAYACDLLAEFLDHCAWGISVAINMFQPELIVVDGFALRGRQEWVDRIAEMLPAQVCPIEQMPLQLAFSRVDPIDQMRELATEFFVRREGIPA